MEALTALTAGPWVLVVVFVVASLDALLPFMPSETTVVAAGVAAATLGHPHLAALVVVAVAGAFAGDQVSYLLGARGAARVDRFRRGPGARDWAVRVMSRRGALLLVVARYLPGGRSATTVTAGVVGYPPARFRCWTGLGVLLWAAHGALLGYLGGVAFADRPLLAVAVAWTTASLGTVVALVVQRVRARRPVPQDRPVVADQEAVAADQR